MRRSLARRLKTELHCWVDPFVALRSRWALHKALRDLPEGEYRLPFAVPYISQFASRELINEYIHHEYDGTRDPNWQTFGSEDPTDYAFWAHRICALACLQMSIMAFGSCQPVPTLWQLVQTGLALDGYCLRDKNGRWIDEGWYFEAQVKLAERYGLTMTGYSYASPPGICKAILDGYLVAATVTPELGERTSLSRRYGGHLVLVVGFRWKNGRVDAYCVHNPSGRYEELQANAWISAQRFHQAYAYRYATLERKQ